MNRDNRREMRAQAEWGFPVERLGSGPMGSRRSLLNTGRGEYSVEAFHPDRLGLVGVDVRSTQDRVNTPSKAARAEANAIWAEGRGGYPVEAAAAAASRAAMWSAQRRTGWVPRRSHDAGCSQVPSVHSPRRQPGGNPVPSCPGRPTGPGEHYAPAGQESATRVGRQQERPPVNRRQATALLFAPGTAL